ncbi:MAG: T9SS type A sorting domain-containing protein [Saprospiraceae bacterium]
MKKSLLLLLLPLTLFSQTNFPYEISLEPMFINGLDGLQSYAYGQHDGQWLLLGGRRDGLHARQPFNAFPASQNNTEIYVVSPENGEVWTASVLNLPTGISEQLQATNIQFFQDGETLYLVGGYGYSNSAADHITFPNLLAVEVSGLMDAIENGQAIGSFFKQITDERLAVTGGQLGRIGNQIYLVGGHRFDGRYNPMNMPTFVQTYTNSIRKFEIENDGNGLAIANFSESTDALHLHRRDYNLLPQIFPDGEYGYTLFSGVFQINQDLPFLYPVDIKEGSYAPVTSFNQYLSQYHSASVALFDPSENAMHNLFFGGMSQYYYNGDNLVQDDMVPFVKTISRVSRAADGVLEEVRLAVEMPALLGAGAEFIPNENLEMAAPEIIQLPSTISDSLFLGYIFGGIESPQLNPFNFNNTGVTTATVRIFKVFVKKSTANAVGEVRLDGYHQFRIEAIPNPTKNGIFQLKINAPEAGLLEIFMTDVAGRLHVNTTLEGLPAGENKVEIEMTEPYQNGLYFLSAHLNGKFVATSKLVLKE